MATAAPTDSKILFLVCEFARTETDGKITLMGYAGTNRLNLKDRVNPNELSIVQIALVFVLQDGEGDFHSELEIRNPKGEIMKTVPMAPNKKLPNQNHTIAININGMPVQELGAYPLTLRLGKNEYHRELIFEGPEQQ